MTGVVGLALVAGCAWMGLGKGPRSEPLLSAELSGFQHDAGEDLLARLDCLACHAAAPEVRARLRPLPAPNLLGVGARLSPSALRSQLERPHGLAHDADAGAVMPDLLGPLSEDQDDAEGARLREDLLHFLVSLGGPQEIRPELADAWPLERGRQLYDDLGCRACHEGDRHLDRAWLARAMDRSSLREFLLAPHARRPSGRMPDLDLDEQEADALACWLLRDRHAQGPTAAVHAPGLRVDAYRFESGPSELPDFDALEPVGSTVTEEISAAYDDFADNYGLRLTGELFVETEGAYQVYTSSDDGSALWIGGERVVDNDGLHSDELVEGSVTLDAGWHPIEITFFENGGDAALDAGWWEPTANGRNAEDGSSGEGDGIEPAEGTRRSFTSDELRTTLDLYEPDDWQRFVLEPERVARGGEAYAQLGCVACHTVDPAMAGRPDAPPLSDLVYLEDGCLAEVVPPGAADYHLSAQQKADLRAVLRGVAGLGHELPPEAVVERDLERFDCLRCHARDGRGGPQGAVRAAFQSTADLGDEGRLPPDLSGVGAKLRPSALHDVIVGDERVRPYMLARMPRFGEKAVGRLPAALSAADAGTFDVPEHETLDETGNETFDAELVEAGKRLAGQGGLSCIQCHTASGQPSIGLPGLDLAVMHERLQPAWFRQWMTDPIGMRPGTRMPTFFADGRSVLRTELDGDAARQIDAVWAYLALGESMPLPPGVVVDHAAYALVPVEQPVYVGAFMQDHSARVLSVGFPENLHVSFDSHHVRLAQTWKGRFFDAEGTWHGRAGQLEVPEGEALRSLPDGAAFAFLATADEPWPELAGKDADWRMLGHRRDAWHRPTFRYTHRVGESDPAVVIEESPRPALGAEGAYLVRRFRVTAAPDEPLPVHRAATARTIEAVDGEAGTFRTDDGLLITVRGGTPRLRATTEGGQELIVELDATSPIHLPRTIDFEVEWRW